MTVYAFPTNRARVPLPYPEDTRARIVFDSRLLGFCNTRQAIVMSQLLYLSREHGGTGGWFYHPLRWLSYETGFGKSTLDRIIRYLESEKVVEVMRTGGGAGGKRNRMRVIMRNVRRKARRQEHEEFGVHEPGCRIRFDPYYLNVYSPVETLLLSQLDYYRRNFSHGPREIIWPSRGQIEYMTGIPKATQRRIVQKFVNDGLLIVHAPDREEGLPADANCYEFVACRVERIRELYVARRARKTGTA